MSPLKPKPGVLFVGHTRYEIPLADSVYGEPGCVYNLGGGGNVAMTAVLDLIKELAGDFRVRQRPEQRGDVHDTAASIERARRELGYDPVWALRKGGLAEQIEWQVERDRPIPVTSLVRPKTR
jgi:nucleoside-diphosphate-sugar epimerase